jgi:hypothetical protein
MCNSAQILDQRSGVPVAYPGNVGGAIEIGTTRRVTLDDFGKAGGMTESDPAAGLEHSADELEHRLDELGDHISDAEKAAEKRREDLDPEVAGDWEDTRGTAGQGEDPEGAVDEDPSSGSPTPGDADGGDD